ncbi:MAG TPA: hypothetical protein VGE74_13605 [Gemmata sp.]
MAGFVRLVVAVAVLLCTNGATLAQREVAPAPHVPLDELVKEYQRLGLPTPPPTAPLVRLKGLGNDPKADGLAFRFEPTELGGPFRYFYGSWWDEVSQESDEAEVVLHPTPADLENVSDRWTDWGTLAIHFRLRGWDQAARAAHAKARKQARDYQRSQDKVPPTLLTILHLWAWVHWSTKLFERTSDRREIWSKLQIIADEDPGALGAGDRWLFGCLRLTLAPRKSKPGSIEALIDDLTEHWDDPGDLDNEIGQTAYWRLVEHGAAAIPALMEHLTDPRLTRTTGIHPVKSIPVDLHVGMLAKFIVNKFSDGQLSAEDLKPLGEWAEPSKQKWWTEAQKVGEERWASDHVLPKDPEQEPIPNEVLLRLIRAKYPNRLKDVYQNLLRKFPHVSSEEVVKAITKSKLSREQKVALLEEGAKHKAYRHCWAALEALAVLDPGVFRKYILTGLENLPAEIKLGPNDEETRGVPIDLISKTDDAECWAALNGAVSRVSVKLRLYIIRVSGWPAFPGEPDPSRRERLRFLLWSLGDEAVKGLAADDARKVHDLATIQLAKSFSLVDRMLDPQTNNPQRSPREFSLLRARVRDLAELELARPAK